MPDKRKRKDNGNLNDDKLRVGILGATGMVGQRFVRLLADHPYFRVTVLAASKNSAGKPYQVAVEGRWSFPDCKIPEDQGCLVVMDACDIKAISPLVDFVFCAVDMPKADVLKLEETYARAEIPVVSNNSAARSVADVPMIIPEINAHHLDVIQAQRARLGTKRGFIAVKPNCSIQSYVPALHPLKKFGLKQVLVCTYQAISGAGKTFASMPEMHDNVIPYIGGEEDKSENEPLKIWGDVVGGKVVNATTPIIAAQCMRVNCSDGHMAAVHVNFEKEPTIDEIKGAWAEFKTRAQQLQLPSAPTPFLSYFEEPDRPQTKLDRDVGNGMGVAIGRLRKGRLFQYKFVCLSHNTLRGAAGGGLLTAELLHAEGFLTKRDIAPATDKADDADKSSGTPE